jgi:hypothetical protein
MAASVHTEKEINLLATWRQAIRVCHKAHIRSAAVLQRKNRAFGIPVVILSTIASSLRVRSCSATFSKCRAVDWGEERTPT